ncbi:MAG: dTMP kinase [Chloroflexi bacterium]|nr:dTMP kinase [Chloroflexota bacterium]
MDPERRVLSLFLSIEGGDGAGKSTQAALLMTRLKAAEVDALLVHEPGGTALGEQVRRLVKGAASPSPVPELFLFEAARAQLVQDVIGPALTAGRVVVTDRYADSSTAYQGYGRGLDLEDVRALNRIATGGLMPDATILLDMPPERALARVDGTDGSGGRSDDPDQARFEREPIEFHQRVAEGFRTMAAEEPRRWFVVDASAGADAVAEKVWAIVSRLLDVRGIKSHA